MHLLYALWFKKWILVLPQWFGIMRCNLTTMPMPPLNPVMHPLLLNLPLIATAIVITRYVLGLRTWQLTPTFLLSFSFYLLSTLFGTLWQDVFGWLSSIIVIMGVAQIAYFSIKGFKMHYYSKLALVYVAAYLGMSINTYLLSNFFRLPITDTLLLAQVLIALLIPYWIELQYRKEDVEVLRRVFFSLALSGLSGFLLTFTPWNDLLVRNWWIVLVILALNILLATTQMLKVTDFIRFRSILRNG